MTEATSSTGTLNTAQVNRLVDIARRFYGLALLADPLRPMIEQKWDDQLDAARSELYAATSTLIAILRRSLPDLSIDTLGGYPYRPGVLLELQQDHVERIAAVAKAVRLRSHRLLPLLTELPDNSQTFADAQKLVDRMEFDAVELLQGYVLLVDSSLAKTASIESDPS